MRLPCRLAAALTTTAVLGSALVGCSTTVHLEPADDANSAACADVSVLLPASVGGFDRVWTDAQATGAWGEPTVVLRCGVAPPAPSDLVCTTIGNVDWLVLGQEEERQRLVTFGREPAIEVIILRGAQVDFQAIIDKISTSIRPGLQPATAECTERAEFPTQ